MQKNIKKYMLVLLAVLLGALLTVCAIPVAQWLSIPENRSLVWQKIDALGPWGAVIFLVIQILLPAAVTLAVSEFMRKKGWIKFGDMKLEL
mgnify:CR=1 FL=1